MFFILNCWLVIGWWVFYIVDMFVSFLKFWEYVSYYVWFFFWLMFEEICIKFVVEKNEKDLYVVVIFFND